MEAIDKVSPLGDDVSGMVEQSDGGLSDLSLVALLLWVMSMSEIHSDVLSFGRYIWNRHVLISHLRTILASFGVPSPFSFLVLVVLLREIGSSTCVGQNMVCMTSGAAFCPFITQFFMSNITMIILLIYPSTAAEWNGTGAISGLAVANGVDGGC